LKAADKAGNSLSESFRLAIVERLDQSRRLNPLSKSYLAVARDARHAAFLSESDSAVIMIALSESSSRHRSRESSGARLVLCYSDIRTSGATISRASRCLAEFLLSSARTQPPLAIVRLQAQRN